MAKLNFFNYIDGYSGRGSERRFLARAYSGSVSARKHRAGKGEEIISRIRRVVAYASSKAYGAMALAFGLVTVIVSFLRGYTDLLGDSHGVALIIGAAVTLLSIPFLLTDKPLSYVFQDNPVTEYLFFDLLCMKRVPKLEGVRTVYTFFAAALGIALGIVGYFVPAWIIVAFAVGLVIVYLAFNSPEFSFLLSLVMLPYSELSPAFRWVFFALVALTFLSMLIKIAYGKRVIFFSQYDVVLAIIVLTIVISGVFAEGADSLGDAAMMVVLAFGYTVASCLVSNRRIADSVLGTLVLSSLPVSVISIVDFIRILSAGEQTSIIGVGMKATFTDTVACAVFLIAAICSAAAIATQGRGVLRVLCGLAMLVQLVALVLTGEMFAIAALIVGLLVAQVIKTGYFSMLILPLLALLPYSVLLLPDSWEDTLFSVIPSLSSVDSLSELWRSLISVFSDNAFIGIGIGQSSFVEEMVQNGLLSESSAHNLLLEIALEAGVICAAAFVLVILVRLRHTAVYSPFVKSSEVAKLCPHMSVAIFAMIFYGATAYVLGAGSAYYLFWVIFGIGGALLRIAAREHDDRVNYYEDNRNRDASDLDVNLFEYGARRGS